MSTKNNNDAMDKEEDKHAITPQTPAKKKRRPYAKCCTEVHGLVQNMPLSDLHKKRKIVPESPLVAEPALMFSPKQFT
jgi:hypothetical protein